MTRTLIIPLLLALFALAGCNQGSESAAPEPGPTAAEAAPETPPVLEPPAQEDVTQAATETQEQIRAELAAQMGDEFANLNLCTDPRPEICTQNYAPVCGVHADGSRSTYSNGCTACSNPEVVGSLPGACPE